MLKVKEKLFESKEINLALFLLGALLVISFLSQFFERQSPIFSREFDVYNTSPNGEAGGRIIPASCPSDLHDDPTYGQPCSASNTFGEVAYGNYQCG